jgi:hypothetical protein
MVEMINKTLNQVYDSNYTTLVKKGGFLTIDRTTVEGKDTRSRFEKMVDFMVGKKSRVESATQISRTNPLANKSLEEQLKILIELPDADYNDNMLNSDLRKFILAYEKEYISTLTDYKTHIAPSMREVKPASFEMSGIFGKTYYASSYPSYIDFLWTRELLNLYGKRDMTRYLYPSDDSAMQTVLKRRATQLRAEMNSNVQKGITLDTELEVESRDVEEIRQKLATREERYFEGSFYATVYEHDEEKLRETGKKFEQKISGYGIRTKEAAQRMDEGSTCMLPLAIDDLGISRSMITTSLAGSFPFISNDLIENTGILYGINLHS